MSAEAQVEMSKPEKVKTAAPKVKGDMLADIAHEIGNLSAEDAINAVPELLNGADENYFRLGGVLSVINTNEFYKTDGFDNFKTFVEAKYGIQYRRAMYWSGIYDALIASGVPWNKVKDVGWTKLKDLAPILTLANVDEWVKKATTSSVLELQEAIKAVMKGNLQTSGDPAQPEKTPTTTLTVKVHEDQKTTILQAIDKAKAEGNTEYPGVALEGICMNYLSGGNVTAKPKSLKDVLAAHSPEDCLDAMEKAHPEFQITASLKKH
jgi:hypothetical protein